MIEQDIVDRAKALGYILSGTYPVEPYYLRGQCGAGFKLVDRDDALAWLDYETKQQTKRVKRFLQQNSEDDTEER